jgi:TPR repeat protein
MTEEWFYIEGDARRGPVSTQHLGALLQTRLPRATHVWRPGEGAWVPAEAFPELVVFIPPPLPARAESTGSAAMTSVLPPVTPTEVEPGDEVPPMPSPGRGSYLRRHWVGDLSLPVSYWINCGFVTIALSLVMTVAARLVQDIGSERLMLAWLWVVAIWTGALITTAWQVVGTWRSAGRHHLRGGSPFWAGTARVMLLVSVLTTLAQVRTSAIPQITELTQIAFGNDPYGRYEVRLLQGATELEIRGAITFGLTDEVQKILTANPQVKTVRLNSNGGRLAEARRLGDLIRQRSLATYADADCQSACTIAFLGGHDRQLAPQGRLGFHQYVFPGVEQDDMKSQYAIDRARMLAAGVRPEFVAQAFTTPSSDMWFPSREQLLENGVITSSGPKADIEASAVTMYGAPSADRQLAGPSQDPRPVFNPNSRVAAPQARPAFQDSRDSKEADRPDTTSPRVQNAMGIKYQRGDGVAIDPTMAGQWYRKAAEQGYPTAQLNLAFLYESGQGVPQDFAEAALWYRRAAEQGLADAQNNLGVLYEKGQGVTEDLRRAVEWYRKAADQHHAQGQDNFASASRRLSELRRLESVEWIAKVERERDTKPLDEVYRKSAEQGNPDSQFRVAGMYEAGRGVRQDMAIAADWYRRAAEQGHAASQNKLGLLHEAGRGLPQNPVSALAWFCLAAASNTIDEAAGNCKRVSAALSPAQVAEGNRQVEEWKVRFSKGKR